MCLIVRLYSLPGSLGWGWGAVVFFPLFLHKNLGEMGTFLEKYNLPKLNEEEAENLNRPITADEIEAVIKKLPTHKSPGPDGFTGEFYRAFQDELTPILHRLFENIRNDGRL